MQNMQKPIVFQYISNEKSENEIKNSTYNHIKKNKILRKKFNKRSVRFVHVCKTCF